MRVLLDTHIFIWYAKEQDKLSNDEVIKEPSPDHDHAWYFCYS